MHLNLFRTKQKDIADVAPVEITALWLQKCIMSCNTQKQLQTAKMMVYGYLIDRYSREEVKRYLPILWQKYSFMRELNKIASLA